MNKRIKELLIKSGLMDSIGCNAYEEDDWEPVVSKFAELIIRECAHVGYHASYYYECSAKVSNKIKDHFEVFGVEE